MGFLGYFLKENLLQLIHLNKRSAIDETKLKLHEILNWRSKRFRITTYQLKNKAVGPLLSGFFFLLSKYCLHNEVWSFTEILQWKRCLEVFSINCSFSNGPLSLGLFVTIRIGRVQRTINLLLTTLWGGVTSPKKNDWNVNKFLRINGRTWSIKSINFFPTNFK